MFKIRITIVLIAFFLSEVSLADEKPIGVVLLSGIEVNALSGPISAPPVLMKSENGCHIHGEADISPIDFRVSVSLKRKVCGNKSQTISGSILGKDQYEGLRIKCLDVYISKRTNKAICMAGEIEAGRVATALINNHEK